MSDTPTTIYLTEHEQQLLQAEAESKHVLLPDLLHGIIADHLSGRVEAFSRADYMTIVGLGQSGLQVIAEDHDTYVAQTIADEHLR
jgi:hypothetical protein